MKITTNSAGPTSGWTRITGAQADNFRRIANQESDIVLDPPSLTSFILERGEENKYWQEEAMVAMATVLDDKSFTLAFLFISSYLMSKKAPMPWSFEEVIPYDGVDFYVPGPKVTGRISEATNDANPNDPQVLENFIEALDHYNSTGENGFTSMNSKLEDGHGSSATQNALAKLRALISEKFGSGNIGVKILGGNLPEGLMKALAGMSTTAPQPTLEAKVDEANGMLKALSVIAESKPSLKPIVDMLEVLNPAFVYDRTSDETTQRAKIAAKMSEIRSYNTSPTLDKYLRKLIADQSNLALMSATNDLRSDVSKIVDELDGAAEIRDRVTKQSGGNIDTMGTVVGAPDELERVYSPLVKPATVELIKKSASLLDGFAEEALGSFFMFADHSINRDSLCSSGIGCIKNEEAARAMGRAIIPAFLHSITDMGDETRSLIVQDLRRIVNDL